MNVLNIKVSVRSLVFQWGCVPLPTIAGVNAMCGVDICDLWYLTAILSCYSIPEVRAQFSSRSSGLVRTAKKTCPLILCRRQKSCTPLLCGRQRRHVLWSCADGKKGTSFGLVWTAKRICPLTMRGRQRGHVIWSQADGNEDTSSGLVWMVKRTRHMVFCERQRDVLWFCVDGKEDTPFGFRVDAWQKGHVL